MYDMHTTAVQMYVHTKYAHDFNSELKFLGHMYLDFCNYIYDCWYQW